MLRRALDKWRCSTLTVVSTDILSRPLLTQVAILDLNRYQLTIVVGSDHTVLAHYSLMCRLSEKIVAQFRKMEESLSNQQLCVEMRVCWWQFFQHLLPQFFYPAARAHWLKTSVLVICLSLPVRPKSCRNSIALCYVGDVCRVVCIVTLTPQRSKSFPEPLWPMGRCWSSIHWPSARHQPKLQDHEHGATLSHGVPVYSPAYADTKLYCLVTEANVCERLTWGRTRQCSGWDWTRDLQSQVQRPNHYATEPHLQRMFAVIWQYMFILIWFQNIVSLNAVDALLLSHFLSLLICSHIFRFPIFSAPIYKLETSETFNSCC